MKYEEEEALEYSAKYNRKEWKNLLNPSEKQNIIDYIEQFHAMYMNVNNSNRFINKFFYFHVRQLSLDIGEWCNCYISKKAKELMGDTKNPMDFNTKKKGKGIIVEHYNPVKCLYQDFQKQGFDAEIWFNSCRIIYITKQENEEMEFCERTARQQIKLYKKYENQYQQEIENLKDKFGDFPTALQIHHAAYEKTGLNDTLTLTFPALVASIIEH